jgi:hypothetical protein
MWGFIQRDLGNTVSYYRHFTVLGGFDRGGSFAVPPFLADGFLTESPVPPYTWRERMVADTGRGADIADIAAGIQNREYRMSVVQLA